VVMPCEHRHVPAPAQVPLDGIPPPATITDMDALADALGTEGGVRITIIDPEGRVLGDSRLDPAAVAALDSHAGQPEVAAVLRSGQPAIASRHSEALDRDMMYAARPWGPPDHRGVVRASVDTDRADAILDRVRVAVVAAGGVGLLVAVFMSGLASHLASRDVRRLMARIREVVARSRRDGLTGQLTDPDELEGLAGGVEDLADRLQAAVATVSTERSRLGALLASMSEAVLALDGETRVTLANPAALRLLGLSAPPEGQRLAELCRSPDLVAVARDALSGEEEGADEIELPGGATVLATARPLQSRSGCVLVLHDITGQRHLERVRRDFVANVSHELRTPVSIIRANAESLVDGALEDPTVAPVFLEAIVRNAERLSALIGDLLDLSRIEAGRWHLGASPVAVAEVARRAADSLQPQADAHHHSLTVSVPEALCVMADERALEHVLLNLLENAVKYTPAGGHIQVRVQAPAGGMVRILVEDDGPGVPERHRSRVFERFYRVDPGRARQQGGTGLGLAIVKNLVESMGGHVGLDPRLPRGSSFWLALPAAPLSSSTPPAPDAIPGVPG